MQSDFSISHVDAKLVQAGRLHLRPVYTFAADTLPAGAVQVSAVVTEGHKCLAKALLIQAIHPEVPPVYLGGDAMKGCCFGASAWLGFMKMPPMMKAMYASVPKGDGKHNAHYLKATPDLCEAGLKSLGRLIPAGKYLVMGTCDERTESLARPVSALCFGTAEQIRNLCGLVHFSRADLFNPVIAAWGAHCATFISYPAGLWENVPKDTAFIGPAASYGNDWFPPDLLALSMPYRMAVQLSEDYGQSFAEKCPDKTYPATRDQL
ncbi:DUF169 domain-containing protein [Methanocella arvoryzae]|uniref:DUF169 domain-containing protein n=1 Tax=Methanocella arvoryzae (strain DSM 22066 / NBRC 105507 / MRE50) TaxID=351160 RepID=Q0W2I4_METAR|nr:DUF169 domain-containing protein [Methanocella arvoryzae]CAJ37409.1 conserved hypothetical protein [Methanocella arvoryzae MRE50]